MDLINWSLNAIDTLFSTRSLGSGEPECPGGTFPAGYTMDGWQTWRIVCLAGLSIEDAEDIYLFGTMIAGFLLIGAGLALAYRRIKTAGLTAQTPTKLPAEIGLTGRGAASQKGLTDGDMVKSLEAIAAAVNTQNNISERILGHIREESAQINNYGRKLDNITDQLAAVARSQNRLCEQKIDKTTELKVNNIMEKLTAIQREMERSVSEC
ncbi:uncharacterized protein LOC134639431 isoform X2 [Pelmatolapia mariae]|uniref:uncharacterized protein LOC134639431 isoform X2 n=1 Tax=Pelmatolapia mariae TaxID=158779 RepID=UPI002FE66924